MCPGFESLKVHHEFVLLTQRVHPFPFRTRKLSSAVATILGGKLPGKIAQREHRVGVSDAEGPPVPIPNTEVKLCSGEDTWWEAARENSSTPTQTVFRLPNGRRNICFTREFFLFAKQKTHTLPIRLFAILQSKMQASSLQEKTSGFWQSQKHSSLAHVVSTD